MKDSSRVQAAIEIIQKVFKFNRPADRFISDYFKSHRYIGGKDRREISALVWQAVRCYGRLSFVMKENLTPRTAIMSLLFYQGKNADCFFNGEKYAPAVLSDTERKVLDGLAERLPEADLECPDWLRGKIDVADVIAMVQKAPLDLRVNTLKTDRPQTLSILRDSGINAYETPFSPYGIRIDERMDICSHPLYRKGWIEIQDEGSQIVSLLTQAKPGQSVIDWCAGGGGKTLALSAMMQAKGELYAVDKDVRRLKDLPERAGRAKADNIILLKDYDHLKTYDLVLVDAPCTSTGTWRRCADAKWRLSEEWANSIVGEQRKILDNACRHVKKGGRLFYITCSLDFRENESQVAVFLQNHQEFELEDLRPVLERLTTIRMSEKTIRLHPSLLHTDGFFAASFIKK